MHLGVSYKTIVKQVEIPGEIFLKKESSYQFYMVTKYQDLYNFNNLEDSINSLKLSSCCSLQQYMHDIRQGILTDKESS